MDDDVGDDALAAMGHGELVALLNRLYARAGERRVSVSTALASTDDELRATIRSVRRRLAPSPADASEPAAPSRKRKSIRSSWGGAIERPAGAASGERVFVVLLASDADLIALARTLLRSRGVALVVVDSSDALASLLANVTPTHVVVDGSAGLKVSADRLIDLHELGVLVRWAHDADEVLAELTDVR